MVNNSQTQGTGSNAHVGQNFERTAQDFFWRLGISVQPGLSIPIGVSAQFRKERKFDLGSRNPPILIECKSHKWTVSGNVPSAKITVWNEAMYYFHLAPGEFRKVLFVLKDFNDKKGVTLGQYYIANYGHLVPDDVEVLEFDYAAGSAETLKPALNGVRWEVMAHFHESLEKNRRLGELLAQ